MVTFSGPNSIFPNEGPKIQRPFQRRNPQLISLSIHGDNQKTIQGSQPPDPAGVGLAINSGLFQAIILRGYTFFKSVVKESSISILLGKLNWSIQASINQTVSTSPNWANLCYTVRIKSNSSNFKISRSVLTQFRQYSW
ncbi:hypothetical protein O181_092740 [Austropuccinia psidii MF-1]|uniref:Uncharacterized protein n=1 Tax=Austropuccinia psidii MF-1 TaxID=1389203 RepID=A0A9Q3P9F8_9BASI|nr:hypothetical protein [Austropuccinia psidii MF-1]